MFAFSDEHVGTSMVLGVGGNDTLVGTGWTIFFGECNALFIQQETVPDFQRNLPSDGLLFPCIICISLHVFAFV